MIRQCLFHRLAARAANRTIWVAVLLFGLLASSVATAQDESTVATVEVRLWAFSSNPQFFAYQTTNHLGDEVFFVGQAGSSEPVYSEAATEDRTPRDILLSREMRDSYGWNSEGVPGLASPNGYWTVALTDSGGPNITAVVTHERQTSPIGTIERILDPGGREYATYEIKEARWSQDNSVVVIVVHQELAGEWPLQVDTANAFTVPAAPAAPAPAPEPQ